MYTCAIIGVSGSRARGHAEAYSHISRGRLAAVSARTREKLNAFAEEFDVDNRYTDYREMLEAEQPDLVHVNTPPNVRLEVLEAVRDAGIPAVIVEKPLAMEGEDWREIAAFAQETARRGGGPKVAINHQLHFHPRRQRLQQLVQEGGIGEIRFVEASSGMNLAYQGTHSLQAIGAFLGDRKPLSVFGQTAGTKGLADTPKKHFAPDQCVASIKYEGGVDAILRCGENAPRVGDRPIHQHKRIAVYGSRGQVNWTMWSWETLIDGRRDGGSHDYFEEDILGQAAMTEAMFDWIEDGTRIHPLNLQGALMDFNIILGLYMSSLQHRVIALPVEPDDHLIGSLRDALGESSAGRTA